jgi:hypothetical protein
MFQFVDQFAALFTSPNARLVQAPICGWIATPVTTGHDDRLQNVVSGGRGIPETGQGGLGALTRSDGQISEFRSSLPRGDR